MGLFDSLKNKAKEIAKSVEDTSNQEEETVNNEEVEEVDHVYEYSDKIVQGVHYPNGWESLEEIEILQKLDDVFEEFKEIDGDDDAEDALFEKYGFKDAGHYEDFKNAIRMERAEQEGVSFTQATINQHQEQQTASLDAAKNSDREDLQPVDGVSLETWAKAMVSVANSGGDVSGALQISGKDQAGWDKVTEEWNTRMANDTSMVIMQVYSAAFTAKATEDKEEITVESFPFEKYIEVRTAQSILTQQGKDPQEVLEMFGMTVMDWSNVGAFWSKEFHSNVEKYHPLDTEYTKKYEEKYKLGDSHDDIDF